MGSSASKTRPGKATKDHLKKRSLAGTTIVVYTDDELAGAVLDLERKLGQTLTLVEPDDPAVAELQSRLEEAIEARDATAVQIRFQAIGRKRYNRLVEDHPPTAEQIAEWQEHNSTVDPGDPTKTVPGEGVPPYNPETFPLALIQATMVSPVFDDLEELGEMLDTWNETEFMQIWMAAMAVCSASRVAHWGKG